MQDILEAEADLGDSSIPAPPRQRRKATSKPTAKASKAYVDDDNFFSCLGVEEVLDAEGEYSPGMPGLESDSDSDSDAEDSDVLEITNVEVSQFQKFQDFADHAGNCSLPICSPKRLCHPKRSFAHGALGPRSPRRHMLPRAILSHCRTPTMKMFLLYDFQQ